MPLSFDGLGTGVVIFFKTRPRIHFWIEKRKSEIKNRYFLASLLKHLVRKILHECVLSFVISSAVQGKFLHRNRNLWISSYFLLKMEKWIDNCGSSGRKWFRNNTRVVWRKLHIFGVILSEKNISICFKQRIFACNLFIYFIYKFQILKPYTVCFSARAARDVASFPKTPQRTCIAVPPCAGFHGETWVGVPFVWADSIEPATKETV